MHQLQMRRSGMLCDFMIYLLKFQKLSINLHREKQVNLKNGLQKRHRIQKRNAKEIIVQHSKKRRFNCKSFVRRF